MRFQLNVIRGVETFPDVSNAVGVCCAIDSVILGARAGVSGGLVTAADADKVRGEAGEAGYRPSMTSARANVIPRMWYVLMHTSPESDGSLPTIA